MPNTLDPNFKQMGHMEDIGITYEKNRLDLGCQMVLKPKILGWLQKLNYFRQNTTWTLWLSGVFLWYIILFNRIIKKLIIK